jgi:hypothetical protein
VSLRPKQLTREEEIDLERSFHDIYRSKLYKSHAQMWYSTVIQFLNWKFEGARIITTNVCEMEDKVLQHDHLCQEYVSALMKIVLPSGNANNLTEHQKMILLMSASSDEREEALLLIQS